MKIAMDGVVFLTLSQTQKDVIKDDLLPSFDIEKDLKRRVHHTVMRKVNLSFNEFKGEWDNKLKAAGIKSIPTNEDAYAELVFSRPDYQDKSAKIAKEETKDPNIKAEFDKLRLEAARKLVKRI